MQGFERSDRQLLDAAALAGHLVPAGSMFAFLAAHRAEVFPDADYADLFAPAGMGRPSLPATQMAVVLVLQALHDYSDRETAEAVRFDVRWKVAIGAPLDDPGLDASSLVYWRNRIARSGRPHRVNDAVKTVVGQTGILKGRRRRAVDSTILADAVATQDTVTQLVSAVRRAEREVPGAAEKVTQLCTGHDYSRPGKPKIDWDDPAAKDALVSALVNDANALVAAWQDTELDERAFSAAARCASAAPPPKTAASGTCTSTRACCAPPGPPGPPAQGCARTTRHTAPHVERAIAQVATWRGRRIKLRYRGAAANNAWLKRRTAALNLRNLLSRGLARRDEAWALAT